MYGKSSLKGEDIMGPLVVISTLNGVIDFGLQKSKQNHQREMVNTICNTVVATTIAAGITIITNKIIDKIENKENE